MYSETLLINKNNKLSDVAKLKSFRKLKKDAEACGMTNDSAYALLLLKTGSYESYVNNNTDEAIELTGRALHINNHSLKSSTSLAINGYFNLATYYQTLAINNKALSYYDSVLLTVKNINDSNNYALDSRYFKSSLYFLQGDYQQAVEESILGMNLAISMKDSVSYLYFLNRKAQSLCFENYPEQALENVYPAIELAKNQKNKVELATAYKTLGFIFEKRQLSDSAKYYYQMAVKTRLQTNLYKAIASDYNDLGNFYLNSLANYKQAEYCYRQTLIYAGKMQDAVAKSLKIALTNMNLGVNFFHQKKLSEATHAYLACFKNLNINLENIKKNPSAGKLSSVANKDLIIPLLQDKVDVLLALYKKTGDKTYLSACIQTSLVMDSVITQIRHEETGEDSKLYWRNKTHGFFTAALEACYLAGDYNRAFYFMEKSRAVLLTDKLNEIGAAAHLPAFETEKQRNYEDRLIRLEQKLLILNNASGQYQKLQIQYLSAKADFERYIDSLEVSYPVYYQYKYADKIPELKYLQLYVQKHKQSFIDYYTDDSTTYILAVAPTDIKFIRLAGKEPGKNNLKQFLQLCSDKKALNNNYSNYTRLSYSIYKTIFQPLQLPKGCIIICTDNIVIPFEALCTDMNGQHFLLNDYSFSYVYSARFLMNKFMNMQPKGSFIGFAPVSFNESLNLPKLHNAAAALNASAGYYQNTKLFSGIHASRKNFFNYISSYSIVNIFSHASADTTDNEPLLFMQDSVIRLSELQRLSNPATQLVLLSACETNIGRAATGEGIYSLARGFSAAGIPSVAATLWKADEEAIYTISKKFNQYLSEGMDKDEALQKAKLYFIQHSSKEKLLPYYWANMILIGNTDVVTLQLPSHNHWWWIVIAGVALISFLLFYKRKKPEQKKS
ncbi:CHAT domain-containing protein [Parafilimonas sp.]|uniref:CHAT domain-containing protein n=1 Tax=Parafilimonas sp. TaxID=1969739 RepID=UPI0039E56EAD